MSDMPLDPFENTDLEVHLWTVEQGFDDTGADFTIVRFTREGWGWLHTNPNISSDGTSGYLDLRPDKDPTKHDDPTA